LKLPFVGVAIAFASAGAVADAKVPPLRNPVFLNIGFVCQWQDRCMERQQRANRHALAYVKKYKPPAWKIQLCNHRAVQRRSGRVDWVSYNHCIRNPNIARPRALASRRR
jgi:hypothetical protein